MSVVICEVGNVSCHMCEYLLCQMSSIGISPSFCIPVYMEIREGLE